MEGDKKKPDSVMDLMQQLQKDIQGSDWLKQNTADQWAKENPELAAEYHKAVSKSKDSGASSTSGGASLTSDEDKSDKVP